MKGGYRLALQKMNKTKALQMKISTNEPKEVVLRLGKALNDESFQIARRYVSDDMKYVGPFGSRDGAEAYLQEIERFRLKFDIQKIFADDKNVCVLYDITVSGITLFACGWFQVNAGRVSSLRVTFDPRPLLALSEPIR
jgi:SnoaL-like domain